MDYILEVDIEDRVEEGDECPNCGEGRMDWLVWLDDETVECQTCKARYDLWQDHSANMGTGN